MSGEGLWGASDEVPDDFHDVLLSSERRSWASSDQSGSRFLAALRRTWPARGMDGPFLTGPFLRSRCADWDVGYTLTHSG